MSFACSTSSKLDRAQSRDCSLDLHDISLGEQALVQKIALQPGNRIACLPLPHFLIRPVFGGVIRGGVRAQPVSEAFDEGGPSSAPRPLGSHLHGGIDGEDIVSVHAHALEPVREGFFSKRCACALLRPGQ